MDFEDPFPTEFGPAIGFEGDRFNYYVKVQL
jgi:hypothetical protein